MADALTPPAKPTSDQSRAPEDAARQAPPKVLTAKEKRALGREASRSEDA